MEKRSEWIEELICQNGGWITFERFMAEALYHPEHGYYSASIQAVGREGDFSTSATLCPAFAEALAHWANSRLQSDFARQSMAVIEVGAGGGDLAANFLKAWNALGFPAIEYIAVETSPRLMEKLTARAAESGFAVCGSLLEALSKCAGQALIISNELVDAFPARQLIWQQDDWSEIVLEVREGKIAEAAVPFTDRVDAEAPGNPKNGERIFIHPRYHLWLADMLRDWKSGAMLTIDYGSARPSNEVRAYRAHDRQEAASLYDQPGLQDLTCDVNFSDLQRWGEGLGWTTIECCPQFDFLERWLPDAEQRSGEDEALQFLRNPIGAGGAFQVLEQRR
ncbi:MAG: SAM-dependent methyltransferase [Puniceicoccales bacterium]